MPRPRDCYRFALSHPPWTWGPANGAQMDEALAALDEGPLDPEERERMERIGDHIYASHQARFADRGDSKDRDSGAAAT